MQIPQEKVKGPLDKARVHPADSEVALKEPHVDTLYLCIYLLRSRPCPSSAALAAVVVF